MARHLGSGQILDVARHFRYGQTKMTRRRRTRRTRRRTTYILLGPRLRLAVKKISENQKGGKN